VGTRHSSAQLKKGTDLAPPASDIVIKGKGKGGVPATSDIATKRGRKRTAPAAEQPEEVNDSDDSKLTPRKAETPAGAPKYQVVIQSPPRTRAKQRIRTNEAGDAIDVPQSPSDRLWVGRGKESLP
jgi:hypothetical protein